AQYSYTPYGELRAAEYLSDGSSLSSESIAAAKGNRLGHQGLREERFDRPWDGAMDLSTVDNPGGGAGTGPYRALCFNRNRMYDPAEGRFTSVDPNGLGLPVVDDSSFGGVAIFACDLSFSITGHYANGMNSHA